MEITTPAAVDIRLFYRSVDGVRASRRYKTLKGARAAAQRMLGSGADLGMGYAVSQDGIATLSCSGCRLADLFNG